MHIRSYQPGDEQALWQVFHSAVHRLAAAYYSPAQLQAWAPSAPDWPAWSARLQALQPFVAVGENGCVLGYADLQADGYIDHFFVAAQHARHGVGRLLMQHLHQLAAQRGLDQLSADVSLNAQPFFQHFGFVLVRQQLPVLRGVALTNAHMRKIL